MPLYDERFITPMRQELTRIGFDEMRTAEDVGAQLASASGTTLLVVNSMCGCAARNARPALARALGNASRPERLLTVFAGQDPEATLEARRHLTGYPPSSPSMGLLKDGKLVFMLERHQIEGRTAEAIAEELVGAFDRFCAKDAESASEAVPSPS